MPKYIWTAKEINGKQIKYHFESDNKEKNFTYAEVINFLKNKDEDFLSTFRGALNSAINKGIPGYFWECVPVSKETINKEFEFVITKSESLNNITQNWTSYKDYINNNHDKYACSFPNLGKDAFLVIPIPKTGPELDFKNISKFTENASEEQWKEFWQEVGNKLSEELEKNEKPKWLSTSGTGVSYLHVRIDNSPKYYVWKEYKKFDKNTPIPKPVANTPKEKILQNLDKICLDPVGNFANSEAVEKYWILEDKYNGDYYCTQEAEKNGQYKLTTKNGEIIDLRQYLNLDNWNEIHKEIIEIIINNVKENPSDWEIASDSSNSQKGNFLRNKKNNVKHYKQGFTNVIEKDNNGNWDNEWGKKDWAEIENALKNSQVPQQPNSQGDNRTKNDKFPFSAKIAIGGVIFVILIIFITLMIKKNRKIKNK